MWRVCERVGGSDGVTWTSSRVRAGATLRPTQPSVHPARATPGRYPAVSVEDDGLGADLGAQRASSTMRRRLHLRRMQYQRDVVISQDTRRLFYMLDAPSVHMV